MNKCCLVALRLGGISQIGQLVLMEKAHNVMEYTNFLQQVIQNKHSKYLTKIIQSKMLHGSVITEENRCIKQFL
jgi:hypothetical protein